MKTKYFEYNRNSGNEKYSEFTEEEYLKAKLLAMNTVRVNKIRTKSLKEFWAKC